MAYVMLATAIVLEVIATTLLKASDGFSRFWPSLGTAVGYGLCFFLLAQALKTIPTGVAYGVWSGVGIVLVTVLARVVHGQQLSAPVLAGMALIVVGVVVMNVAGPAH